MGFSRIFDRQPPVEKFVRLEVLSGELSVRVVVLRKEAAGAQDHAIQSVFEKLNMAQPLGGEFRHAVDVARRERSYVFVEPDGGAVGFLPDRLRYHQRGRRSQHEPVVPRFHRRPQQVQRAGDIDVDERLRGDARDIWLMKRACVDHGLDAMLAESALHNRRICDGTNDLRIRSAHDIEAGHAMAGRPKARRQEPAQPSGRAGEKHAHGDPK